MTNQQKHVEKIDEEVAPASVTGSIATTQKPITDKKTEIIKREKKRAFLVSSDR